MSNNLVDTNSFLVRLSLQALLHLFNSTQWDFQNSQVKANKQMHLERKKGPYDSCWRQILTICCRMTSTLRKIWIFENVDYERLSRCNIVIYKKHMFSHSDDQNICHTYIWSSSTILDQRSQNLWYSWGIRTIGATFVIILCFLSSSYWNCCRVIKVKREASYS